MRPAPSNTSTSIVVAESAAELQRHVLAWEDLADNCAESNVSYEPWTVLPALQAFGSRSDLLFVLIYQVQTKHPEVAPSLCGFFPFKRLFRYKRLPIRALRLWVHDHCLLGTPLVREGCVAACLKALFEWAGADVQGAPLLEFPEQIEEGPFYRQFVEYCSGHRHSLFPLRTFSRPLFRADQNADTYPHVAKSGRGRRALERRKRRLQEQGRLTFRTLDENDNCDEWIEQYLRLEANGWKGKAGTAMKHSEAERTYFRSVVAQAHDRGQLLAFAYYLYDRPIAQLIAFVRGNSAFAYKTAYDERFAKYSPGVLLQHEIIAALRSRPEIRSLDSCLEREHPMMCRLWKDRRKVTSVLVSAGRPVGDWIVSMLPWWGRCKRRLAGVDG